MGAQEGFLLNFYSRRFSTEFQGLGKILECLVGTAKLKRDGEGGPSSLLQPEQFHSHPLVFRSSISWHKRILHLKYLNDQSISTPEWMLETKKYKRKYSVRREVLCWNPELDSYLVQCSYYHHKTLILAQKRTPKTQNANIINAECRNSTSHN